MVGTKWRGRSGCSRRQSSSSARLVINRTHFNQKKAHLPRGGWAGKIQPEGRLSGKHFEAHGGYTAGRDTEIAGGTVGQRDSTHEAGSAHQPPPPATHHPPTHPSAALALNLDARWPGNIDAAANPELAGLTTGQVMDR